MIINFQENRKREGDKYGREIEKVKREKIKRSIKKIKGYMKN